MVAGAADRVPGARLEVSAAREQRNMGVIQQLQQSSASSFASLQGSFSGAMTNAQALVQQSGKQLGDLMQRREQEHHKFMVCRLCS